MTQALRSALAEVRSPATPYAALSAPFLALVPGEGASLASLGRFDGNKSISLTDDLAGEIDMVQFDLTQGPCWDALEHRDAVLEPDVRGRPSGRWPVFLEAMQRRGVGALFATPVTFGPFELGVVDVYSTAPMSVAEEQVIDAAALATGVGRRLMQRTADHVDHDTALRPRRVVHQATGVILAQVDITPDDAYLLLYGHAHDRRQSAWELAEQIVAGELEFRDDGELVAQGR